MPIINGKYKNPGWVNDTLPAIDEREMNAISDTLEGLDAQPPLPSLTAPGSAGDLLSGKQLIDANGNVLTGTMPAATQATPSISVSSGGLITASAAQTAGYVPAGTKSATQQLPTQAAATVTPGTSSKTAVAAGRYTTGAVTVAGDSDLTPENIKSGVSIFGISGSYHGNGIPSDATLSSPYGSPGGMYSGYPTTSDIEGFYGTINSASLVYMFKFNYLGSEDYNKAGSNKYVVTDIMILNSGTTVTAVILQAYYTGTYPSITTSMYLNPSRTGASLGFSSRQLVAHINLPALTGQSSFVFLPNESWQPSCYM